MQKLFLQNTLSEKKEEFIPIDENQIRLYACGPTVYDRAHLGNARSAVVFDLLFRVLRKIYGQEKVIYVRNVTDVDDKIINRAVSENLSAPQISKKYLDFFHEDMKFLGCLTPSIEPKATEYIDQIIDLINRLIEKNHAYIGLNGDVFFRVASFENYGKLSKRKFFEQIAGARIEKNSNKENPEDFVLWKSAKNFDSEKEAVACAVFDGGPFGPGRPGWHIECSAMIFKNFGENFDIHGGGADLKFPHHENEIAQSCCAFEGSKFANYWVHNGFLMIDGQKMSKSLGNFLTMSEIRSRGFSGELVRYIFLMVNYHQPLNWNDDLIQNAKNNLSKIVKALRFIEDEICENSLSCEEFDLKNSEELAFLLDNLNSSVLILHLQGLVKKVLEKNASFEERKTIAKKIYFILEFLGLEVKNLFSDKSCMVREYNEELIKRLIGARAEAKKNKDFDAADRIRKDLEETLGVKISDLKDGSVSWEPIE
jgi:cysteinyl-tRNA synthetase